MNIINRKTSDKDPFSQSDRDGFLGNGKGDKPRNLSRRFRDNYDLINWGPKKSPKKK